MRLLFTMRIIGHGIDIVETARIERLIDQHGTRFLERCYGTNELAYAEGKRCRSEHLAGRFAAKEAVLKAMGTGLSGRIQWTDVLVLRKPDGQPFVTLTGEAQRIAQELEIDQWWISISHIATHATASAIAVATDG